ncbi:unnamed protein product [Vitrella brassicaformis CCMP3155]|uniref:Large ribosomal subunit protein uL23 N-terminal domain-containing protein n=2 Tax=Vitrella brassicaformis TaxID=1169539 RepID=A0A0G4EMQ8_VITBC|nr:unnamed protein product [Vitrella brassicaformis CCMP3155]|eukprot:CEL98455.1 unnamed protein product [Vitrella brassicaformis CCMP3155]
MAPKGKGAKGKKEAVAAAEKTADAVKKVRRNRTSKVRTSVRFYRPKTLEKPRKPLYPRRSVPRLSKMDHTKIIKSPLTTESAMKKIEENNTLVFLVDPRANKRQIKDAVKKMYDIAASRVNTLIRPDAVKKAYVRLTDDYDALDVANKIGII